MTDRGEARDSAAVGVVRNRLGKPLVDDVRDVGVDEMTTAKTTIRCL